MRIVAGRASLKGPMPTDERVLVIPTSRFRTAGYFHGFRAADEAYLAALLDPAAFSFRPRREVETDPDFKQLIPYVVPRCGADLFHYRRGSSGAETRLAALRSVGNRGLRRGDMAAGRQVPSTA